MKFDKENEKKKIMKIEVIKAYHGFMNDLVFRIPNSEVLSLGGGGTLGENTFLAFESTDKQQ